MKKKNKKNEQKKENINKLLKTIFNSVGLAMGVAVIVLFVLKELSADNAIIMLGIGLFCVAFPSMMKRN